MNEVPSTPRDARWRPLAILLPVGVACALLIRLCPEEGWNIAGHTIRLEIPAAWSTWMSPDAEPDIVVRWKPEDVQNLLQRYEQQLSAIEAQDTIAVGIVSPMSSTPPVDSTTEAYVSPPDSASPLASDAPQKSVPAVITPTLDSTASPDAKDWIPGSLRIRIPEEAQPAFHRLFAKLENREPVNVLHYGDSQIEGDRISGTLRRRWQERWGGFGPGIQPPVPLVQSFALTQKLTGTWSRHTRFGRRDTTDTDENYGILASYATADTTNGPACIKVGTERRSSPSFGRWTHLELWHDTVHSPCVVRVGDVPTDTLVPGVPPGILSLAGSGMKRGESPVSVCFEGAPPKLFALHPVGAGVQWHSVAMRGSSGTLFRKLTRGPFRSQIRALAPDLIVLQYGGNTVPYTRDSTAAMRYGGWFKRQIELFQGLLPDAAILVIGPSDMAEKTGTKWTSFPMLNAVKTALLDASLDAGVAHWDLLGAMGGVGSMPAWVASSPALAGPDHIHFTPRGARQVGEWLDRALWAEFRRWKTGGATPDMTGLKPRPSSVIPLQVKVGDGE